MADIAQSVFEAIDVIVDKRLQELDFDKSITATIIEVEDGAEEGKENKYVVANGTAKYSAYSDKLYKVNTSVYVNIPNGDFSQKKFITGYSLGENETSLSSTTKSQFIELKEDVWSCKDEISILANSSADKEIVLINNGQSLFNKIKGEYNYSVAKLTAEFKTELFSAISGDYGLIGEIKGYDRQGNGVSASIRLSTSDMFGDVYSFDGWNPQEIYFDIGTDFNVIVDVQLQLTQNNNFKIEGNKMLESEFMGKKKPDNIFVRNISISLGYLKNQLSDSTLLSYPNYNGINYNTADTSGKEMRLRWVKKDGSNYRVFEDAISAKNSLDSSKFEFIFEWYKEVGTNNISVNETENETSALINTAGWNVIEEASDFILGVNDKIDTAKEYQSFAAAIGIVDLAALEEAKKNLTEEEFKKKEEALRKIYTKITKSSATTFENLDSTTAAEVAKQVALEIRHKNSNDGIYLDYEDGSLMDGGGSATKRFIYPDSSNPSVKVEKGDTIKYFIPVENTMIDSSDYKIDPKDGYKIIEVEVPNKEEDLKIEDYEIYYRISSEYNTAKDINNIIKCELKKKESGEVFTAEKEIVFGSTGSMGTPWSIEIKLEREYDKSGNIFNESPVLHAIPRSMAATNKVKLIVEVWNSSTKKKYDLPENVIVNWIGKDTDLKIERIEKSNEFFISWVNQEDSDDAKNARQKNWGAANILEFNFTLNGIELKKIFAIPMKANSSIDYLLGTTTIKYDSYGSAAKRTFNNYELIFNGDIDESSINYSLIAGSDDKYAPTLSNDNRLVPIPIYVENDNIYQIQVSGKYKGGNSSTTLFSQPIYIYQDRWSSAILNNWNGDLTINKNNDTILSAMMAAGKKDENNTFSGVVMGDIDVSTEKGTGLWGFHKGQQSFGFKSDGTAFIGAPTGARIEFDGTNGFIQNADFEPVTEDGKEIGATKGLKIDFANAKILSPSFQLTQETGTTATAGTIAGWSFDTKKLIAGTGKNTISLFSTDQVDENGKPINTGITGTDVSTNTWRLKIGDNFGVTSAGIMYASVIGQVTEVSGSISEQLNELASDHQTIEDDIDGIEDRLEELEKNISPVTPGGNNRYLNQRVSDLETFVGEKDEADKNEKTLYQRVVDLENTVADIKAWKESYKAESIAWITGFTPQTETITITGANGEPKTITVITGITPSTETKTVLVKNT